MTWGATSRSRSGASIAGCTQLVRYAQAILLTGPATCTERGMTMKTKVGRHRLAISSACDLHCPWTRKTPDHVVRAPDCPSRSTSHRCQRTLSMHVLVACGESGQDPSQGSTTEGLQCIVAWCFQMASCGLERFQMASTGQRIVLCRLVKSRFALRF